MEIIGAGGRTLAEEWAAGAARVSRHERPGLPEHVPAVRPEHERRHRLGDLHDRGGRQPRDRGSRRARARARAADRGPTRRRAEDSTGSCARRSRTPSGTRAARAGMSTRTATTRASGRGCGATYRRRTARIEPGAYAVGAIAQPVLQHLGSRSSAAARRCRTDGRWWRPSLEQSSGWPVIVAYALVCAATQVLWLTFAAITTETAQPLRRIGRRDRLAGGDLPAAVRGAGDPRGDPARSLVSPGAERRRGAGRARRVVRLGGETFAWAMAGQVMVAVAQPLVLSAVSKLAGEYLPVEQRARGHLGRLGGRLRRDADRADPRADARRPRPARAAAGGRGGPRCGRGRRSGDVAAPPGRCRARSTRRSRAAPRARCGRCRRCARCAAWCSSASASSSRSPPGCRRCSHPPASPKQRRARCSSRWSSRASSAARCCRRSSRAGGAERGFMRAARARRLRGCVCSASLPGSARGRWRFVAMGVVLLPALPIILTAAERLAGAAAGTAGAIVWLAGNLGGLVVALLVQVLVHQPLAAFLAMAAVSLLGLPLAARLTSRALDARAAHRRRLAPAEGCVDRVQSRRALPASTAEQALPQKRSHGVGCSDRLISAHGYPTTGVTAMSTQTTIDSNELFIGGEWAKPQGAERISVTAASTEEPVGSVPEARTPTSMRPCRRARGVRRPGGWSSWPARIARRRSSGWPPRWKAAARRSRTACRCRTACRSRSRCRPRPSSRPCSRATTPA